MCVGVASGNGTFEWVGKWVWLVGEIDLVVGVGVSCSDVVPCTHVAHTNTLHFHPPDHAHTRPLPPAF